MKRALIFGAYANGNLGDAEQAASVARHIARRNPDLEIVSVAHSVADRLYYPGPASIARNMADILDLDFVNSFDVLFIGGGGLLASKHRPLASATWVEGIQIPIVILGVGASREVADICAPLIRKAAIVTARDPFSIEALSHLRPDTFLLRDPILNDRSIDAAKGPPGDGPARLCAIPRKMVSKAVAPYSNLRDIMLPRDFVISVFPTTDEKSGALVYFEKQTLHNTVEMKAFANAASKASVIVSDRYHGCILGLKLGIPTLPCTRGKIEGASKVYSLYAALGMSDELYVNNNPIATRKELFELARRLFNETDVRAILDEWNDEFDATFDRIAGEIGF